MSTAGLTYSFEVASRQPARGVRERVDGYVAGHEIVFPDPVGIFGRQLAAEKAPSVRIADQGRIESLRAHARGVSQQFAERDAFGRRAGELGEIFHERIVDSQQAPVVQAHDDERSGHYFRA